MAETDKNKRLSEILDFGLPLVAFLGSVASPDVGRGIQTAAGIAQDRLQNMRLQEALSLRREEANRPEIVFQGGRAFAVDRNTGAIRELAVPLSPAQRDFRQMINQPVTTTAPQGAELEDQARREATVQERIRRRRALLQDPGGAALMAEATSPAIVERGQEVTRQRQRGEKALQQRRREMFKTIRSSDLPREQKSSLIKRFITEGKTHEAIDEFEAEIVGEAMSHPVNIVQLSYAAAGSGPQAEQAQRALQLLPDELQQISLSTLSYLAAGKGEEAERAQTAIDTILKIRQTGVRRKSRGEADDDSASSFLDLPPPQPHLKGREASEAGQTTTEPPPPLEELPGGGVRGKGTSEPQMPRVKSFRRIN